MLSVGIRELKNNLSRYLREVATGKRVLVTDRGHVVAELRPPEDAGAGADRRSRYDRLVAAGVIRAPRGAGDPFAAWPAPGTVQLRPGTVQALIDEDRDER